VLGLGVSLVQGISAIAIVGVLALALGAAQRDVLGSTTLIEVVSYGLILAIGAHLLWKAVRARGHAHDHAQCSAHGQHHHGPERGARAHRWRMMLAAGLTPCASAIIVLLFGLANHAFAAGVAAALVMSLGMGATVAGIGLATVYGRGLVERVASGAPSLAPWVERGVAFGGAALLVGFSGLMLLGAAARL
jgi:nickel/cobalt exporter